MPSQKMAIQDNNDRYEMRKLLATAIVGVLLTALTGCGQKGPLRRPSQVNNVLPADLPEQQIFYQS
jgi:predicted small lipoprotein YifL